MRVRSYSILLAIAALLFSAARGETSREREDPKEALSVAVYGAYFALREVMSDDMWGNLRKAADSLRQQYPDNKDLNLLAVFIDGERSRQSKQFDLAGSSFKKANQLAPDSSLPFLGLAETALDRGDSGKAKAFLFAAEVLTTKSIPKNFQHLCFARVGDLYEQAGDYTEALKAYKKSLLLAPNWGWGQRNIAQMYLTVNQPTLALQHVRKAILLEPKEAYNYFLLGAAQSKLGQSDASYKAFLKALELDPGNARFHFRLGLEYEGRGENPLALRSYLTAKHLAEQNQKFRDLLPDLNEALARLEKQ